MKRWVGIPLSFLFVLALLLPSAWANEELHPGGRLFFPLWDVSTPNRLTFIVLTREALNENQSIVSQIVETAGGATFKKIWYLDGTGNCIPRGKDGSSSNVNRTDLDGANSGVGDVSLARGVFVDDVHLEYYGKSCSSSNETVKMSCGDIDLFLLASYDNSNRKPRIAFADVAAEGRGALDVHLTNNTSRDPSQRKEENSLMGHAIISDLAQGWAAVYPAAAAKATSCFACSLYDGGTRVGYENYPMEVYMPWAFADLWDAPGGQLRNVLSLWGPGFMPGDNLSDTTISLSWKWWDGRERWKEGSKIKHSVIAPLGGPAISDLDSPLDTAGFVETNFTCDRASGGGTTGFGSSPFGGKAENDGFPRVGNGAGGGQGCGPGNPAGVLAAVDTDHPSDNYESAPDINTVGHSIQQSTSIGWWRFQLRRDQDPPVAFNPALDHSGRGLVGVVLSSSGGTTPFFAVGDSWRLWHKDPCKIAQSGVTFGPPHLRDAYIYRTASLAGVWAGDIVSFFNTLPLDLQGDVCEGEALLEEFPRP